MLEFALGVAATVLFVFILSCLHINPRDDDE